jgi:hypothetical protein
MEGGGVGHKFERDPPKDHPCQVWFNLVSIMMSFLVYITGFFMNFELLPIMQIRKKEG